MMLNTVLLPVDENDDTFLGSDDVTTPIRR